MYQQYLDALHMLDGMFKVPLSEEDAEITKPYVKRWAQQLSTVEAKQSPMSEILGVADRELDLPLQLKDAPAESVGDIDISEVL